MKGFTFLFSACTLLFLGFHLSIAQDDEQEECPLNEEDVDCVNRCNTCEHKNKACPSTDECNQGCDCKSGFLRNKFGYCIPSRYCGKQSPGDKVAGDGRQNEADSGGCPSPQRCLLSCRRRGFLRAICTGARGRTCRCFDRREIQVDGSKAVDVGCPNVSRCNLSCQNKGFPGGNCIGREKQNCRCRKYNVAGQACPLGGCTGSCYRTVFPGGRCGCICPQDQLI